MDAVRVFGRVRRRKSVHGVMECPFRHPHGIARLTRSGTIKLVVAMKRHLDRAAALVLACEKSSEKLERNACLTGLDGGKPPSSDGLPKPPADQETEKKRATPARKAGSRRRLPDHPGRDASRPGSKGFSMAWKPSIRPRSARAGAISALVSIVPLSAFSGVRACRLAPPEPVGSVHLRPGRERL